eukprot:jgi/Tetstr1/455036/TSEL_041892.t1
MDLDGPALPSSWNLLKAVVLKSETTWNAVKEMMEAHRDYKIPHPNEKEIRAALVKVNESKISRPIGIKNAFALVDVPVPKHYKIHWCLEAKRSPRGAGIAWDMEVDTTTNVDRGFLAELTSLPRCPGGENIWSPDNIQDYVTHIISGNLKCFPMGTKKINLSHAEANPRPKVKPDPKPAAPTAKPKPKPKADRKPAAPKATAKSKVAPEPPKGRGLPQRKRPRHVLDNHKRLEKKAAAKEPAAGTTMDTLE